MKHNKKLRTIVSGNWNNTRTNSFLEMGKSSFYVQNVFKGLSLTGRRIHVYSESHVDIYHILKYFSIHCVYLKILNTNNEFCGVRENIYLSEVLFPIWCSGRYNGIHCGRNTHFRQLHFGVPNFNFKNIYMKF